MGPWRERQRARGRALPYSVKLAAEIAQAFYDTIGVSTTDRSELRDQVRAFYGPGPLDFECSTCGARIDEPCRGRHQSGRSDRHATSTERYRSVTDDAPSFLLGEGHPSFLPRDSARRMGPAWPSGK